MRLTRIFVPAPLSSDTQREIPAQQSRHLARVLRLEAGAPLILFNGEGGEFDATIESVRRDTVTVRIGTHQAVERESPLHITLLQGIARGEKMDLILQKATELGVTRIVPVTMARSSVRLSGDNAQRKQEHWQAVVISASEQCGRNRIPEVGAPVSLASATQGLGPAHKLLLTPDEESRAAASIMGQGEAGSGTAGVALLVGPEGGFDPAEVQVAKLAGFVSCRLGPRVLRTETAGLAALAVIQLLAGDFR